MRMRVETVTTRADGLAEEAKGEASLVFMRRVRLAWLRRV